MNKSRVSLKVTALMMNLFFVASSLILPFNKNVHAATTPVNVPITRVAGIVGKQVQSGYSGDNGLATNAQLSFLLNGVAMDRDGNAYIADNGSYRIRKVDALTGNITTIAGNGTSGDTGDGGLAINAQITGVSGIALDSKNNIYFTEGLSSNKVRKIDAITGNISTIAGKVQSGYAGDGTSAINAQFSDPIGIAIDKADNIYIADNFNNRVRKIDAQTGNISTVAGNGTNARAGDNGPATSASFKNVMDVAVDKDFNIYIADSNGHSIRKVAAATGNIYTIAGTGTAGDTGNDGPATSATLQNPNSVKIDDSGNIYISDCVNNKIKKVDATTQKITTIGGTGLNAYGGDDGLAINADIGRPSILALDHSGNVYVPSNCLIRKIDVSTGIISRFAGSVVDAPYGGYRGDNGASINAALNYPQGVATDKQNNIYIADTNNNRVRKIDAATGNISTIAGNGTQAYGGDGGSAVNAKLNYPSGVAVDNEGNLYIADFYNNAIRKVDAVTGNISTIAGNGYVTGGYSGDGGLAVNAKLYQPSAVAVDNDNNIYIVDTSNNRIRKIDAVTGNISTIAGTTQAGYAGDGDVAINAKLNNPRGICLDKDGNIYIADYGNCRIRKIDGAGIITTIAGKGSTGFSGDGDLATNAALSPIGLAIDNEGDMYIADYANNRIRKIDGAGIITTIAGTGVSGFSWDNSSAVNATLSYPRSVAVDSIGNVFIADTFNSEIRKLSMPQTASGLTVATEAEVPAKQDKVMLSVSSGIVEDSDKIYYKVDDTVPQQLYVGDTIDLNDWTEFIGANAQEITAPNGKYIEAVEVTTADNKVVKWGKSNVVNDGYVVSASLSRNAASFDKNTSNQADVSVDMTLNGNTLTNIVNGVTPLISGIDYTVNENTVTINKSYLASLDAGATANLVFNFSAGDSQSLNVTVTDTTPSAACGLTVTAEAETPAVSGKVTLTVTPAVDDSHHVICYRIVDSEPTALNVGEEIEPGDGWIELANTNVQEIAVANGKYIEAVEVTTGNYKVTKWGKSSAVNDGCIVQVGSSISPITASFDKNTANQADVNVSMGLSKYKLESISMRNGANYLSHEFRGNTVTIKKSDLANLSSQSAELAFYDDKGNIKNLDVAMLVGDMGVDLTMSLNGKSLTSITNEGNTLVNGTDYVVNGSTVTIKRGFLTKVGTGTVNLVFNFGTESLAMTVSLSGTDLSATMILDGNTLTGINNSDYDLINGVDYTVNGDVVTISKGYLAKLTTGTQDLMFNFSKGNAQKLSITISDTTTRSYTVTFKDYDGKTIGEPQTVNYGESAAAPAAPTRTGYVFAGWDKSYNDVTGDLVVTAKYTSGNTYPFQPTTSNGDDETKISTDYLKSRDNTLVINSAAASLAIPSSAIDLVNGADHIKVTEKVVTPETNTVQGLFGNLPNGVAKMVGNPIRLNVGLFDASDALIQDIHQFSNNQRVKVTIKLTSAQIAGLDASKLSMYYYDETSRTWVELGGSFNTNTMEFTFYTPHFTNFAIMNKASTPTPSTGNTTPAVTSYTVTFKNYDGTVIGTPQAVNYGGSATAPAAPTRTGYVFAGWDKAFDKVTGDLVVTAKYTSGNTYNFKTTTTSNGAETKISSDYLTSRDNTLVINSDGAEISIPAGAIDSTDGTSYIKVIEQSDTAANISNQFGNLPKGLKQVGNPLLLSIELFDANNNYIKNIHKLANNEKIKVTMNFTDGDLKGIAAGDISMYYYDETAKTWNKLEGSFDKNTMKMTFYMITL